MIQESLLQYKALKSEKAQLEELLEVLELQKSSPGLLPEPYEVRADQVRLFYEGKISELDRTLLEIESAIAKLPSTERQIIRLRYIQGKTWDAVADSVGYCRQQVFRIHKKALARLAQTSPQ